METIRRGDHLVPGFGVGNPFPQSAYVRPAAPVDSGLSVSGKVGTFVTAGLGAVIASAAAVALAGEGPSYLERVRRAWPVLATTALTGGVVGVVAA